MPPRNLHWTIRKHRWETFSKEMCYLYNREDIWLTRLLCLRLWNDSKEFCLDRITIATSTTEKIFLEAITLHPAQQRRLRSSIRTPIYRSNTAPNTNNQQWLMQSQPSKTRRVWTKLLIIFINKWISSRILFPHKKEKFALYKTNKRDSFMVSCRTSSFIMTYLSGTHLFVWTWRKYQWIKEVVSFTINLSSNFLLTKEKKVNQL